MSIADSYDQIYITAKQVTWININGVTLFKQIFWSKYLLSKVDHHCLGTVALTEPYHVLCFATSPDKPATKRAPAPVNLVYDLQLILSNCYLNVERSNCGCFGCFNYYNVNTWNGRFEVVVWNLIISNFKENDCSDKIPCKSENITTFIDNEVDTLIIIISILRDQLLDIDFF